MSLIVATFFPNFPLPQIKMTFEQFSLSADTRQIGYLGLLAKSRHFFAEFRENKLLETDCSDISNDSSPTSGCPFQDDETGSPLLAQSKQEPITDGCLSLYVLMRGDRFPTQKAYHAFQHIDSILDKIQQDARLPCPQHHHQHAPPP